MKKYHNMTDEELTAAKRAADEEQQKLRAKKRELAQLPEQKRPAGFAKLETQIKQLRQVKLDIQAEQDRRQAPLAADAHVIGVSGGIVSGESVGQIGGGKSPRKQ